MGINKSKQVTVCLRLLLNDRSGNRLCDSCSEFLNTETQAVKSCLTCSNSYCETHVRKHYTEARFKKHELVDVSRGLELCEGHGKPLEVFCLTDQIGRASCRERV